MTSHLIEHDMEARLINNIINIGRSHNVLVKTTETSDNVDKLPLKRSAPVNYRDVQFGKADNRIALPGESREFKQKVSITPANYKRKIISLLESLENSTLDTQVDTSAKRELIEQYEIMKKQLIISLTEVKEHLEMLRMFDEVSKRRDRQRSYRFNKLAKAKLSNDEIDILNTMSNEPLMCIPDIQAYLKFDLRETDVELFSEFD